MIKIAISGCRHYDEHLSFVVYLSGLMVKNISPLSPQNIMICHGGQYGVDTLVHKFCKEKKYYEGTFHADCDKHGSQAGPIRNQNMINFCDMLFAFPSKKSKGTWDAINKAKKKGIPITIKYVEEL